MTGLCFVDCETTGLDPDRHEVWEVAIIRAHHNDDGSGLVIEDEWQAFLPVDLTRADPNALRIGRYYQRYPFPPSSGLADGVWPVENVAREVAYLTGGRHLVGAVPSFDAAFLSRLLVANGYQAAWHYHLVDVEALAAGRLMQPPPWNSDELTGRLGVTVDRDDRHTAMGDARWALRTYEAVMWP